MRHDGPVVGFDLDMTLVDSAAGIVATLRAALAEVGVRTAAEQVWAGIGEPLERLIGRLAPGADPVAVAERYRALYPDLGVPSIRLLPGANDAIATVHALGGEVLVVSAKVEPTIRQVLTYVAVEVDAVAGGLFAAGKGAALRQARAAVYVGDHPGDVEASLLAGAAAVAVSTGPHDRSVLAAAGADVVLGGLPEFPGWLERWWRADPGGLSVAGLDSLGPRRVQSARRCVTCRQAR